MVYEPYLEGTHDEKMFRVVKDRDRWFGVVMGEAFAVDERATELLEDRVPLPNALARQLSMDLSLMISASSGPVGKGGGDGAVGV